MMTTFAIIYEVETQPIWSSGVPKLARISVKPTLTIEMSRNAINPASITPMVIAAFDPESPGGG
jgi:hypothetical protein